MAISLLWDNDAGQKSDMHCGSMDDRATYDMRKMVAYDFARKLLYHSLTWIPTLHLQRSFLCWVHSTNYTAGSVFVVFIFLLSTGRFIHIVSFLCHWWSMKELKSKHISLNVLPNVRLFHCGNWRRWGPSINLVAIKQSNSKQNTRFAQYSRKVWHYCHSFSVAIVNKNMKI